VAVPGLRYIVEMVVGIAIEMIAEFLDHLLGWPIN